MQVYLFGYSKKKNSTAQPTLTSGTAFTMQLKDDTSVMNPVLLLNQATSGMPSPFTPSYYTYAYIGKFSRYYFVTDWKWVNGLWELYLTEDVLASFKSAIGSTSAYVERSASASDGNIIDKLYPAKTDFNQQYVACSTSWYNVAPSGGCYVLGIINQQSSNHIGAVTYYAVTSANLNSLLAFLFSNNIYQSESITEIGEGLFKSLFNPFQYIVSCIWFPFATSAFGSTSVTVKVGYWDTGVSAIIVDSLMETTFITATMPNHPQAATRGAFLNYAPYTRMTLYCPPFGAIPLDTTYLRKGPKLNGCVWVDHITGQATLRVAFIASNQASVTVAEWFAETSAMFGVPIQLAQIMADYTGAINTLANGVSSGSIAGIIGSAIGATVESALASQSPKVTTSGANGSFLMVLPSTLVVVEHAKLVDEDNTDLGRPLMSTRTISTLSGYIKCADAHFSASCYDAERDAINQHMVDGFFYE